MPRLWVAKTRVGDAKTSYSCSPRRTIESLLEEEKPSRWGGRALCRHLFLISPFKGSIFIHLSSYAELQLLLRLVKCLPLSIQEAAASQWCRSAPVQNLLAGSLSLQSIWDFSVHKLCHSGTVVHSLVFPVCVLQDKKQVRACPRAAAAHTLTASSAELCQAATGAVGCT